MNNLEFEDEELEIKDLPIEIEDVQCAMVSDSIIYYVSFSKKDNKLYKLNTESGLTLSYSIEELTKCTHITYNRDINKVLVTVKGIGVFWFEPGTETEFSQVQSFPSSIQGTDNYKIGMVCNGVQGLLKAQSSIYYGSDMLRGDEGVKLDIDSEYISEAVFLSSRYIALLSLKDRRLIVFDLEENKKVSEMVLKDEGSATAMSIDEEKKRLVVGIRYGKINDQSSSFGYVYQFKVSQRRFEAPIIEQVGQPFFMGDKNSGIYSLKLTRVPNYQNQLIAVASIYTHEKGKNQIRIFQVDVRQQVLSEIEGIFGIESSRNMYDIEMFENSFVVGAESGKKVAYINFK